MPTEVMPSSPDAIVLSARERALWAFLARQLPFIGSVTIILGLFAYLLILTQL